MKYIPNILTIIRLILVPLFPIVFFSQMENAHFYALIIFLVASLTDFLDGYLARKYNVVSIIGIVLDPLADKLMLMTTLGCLYISEYIPIGVLIIILIKETSLVLSGIFLYFKKEKTVIPSNKFGKMATVVFSLAIVLTIIFPNSIASITTVIVALFLELIALSSYVNHYFRNIKNQTV
ncbi:CDP-diacylglycerol--glycerol-3-phosphate 3-phosphatidyltransferase [Vallitalea pronyensis]|uniref:CDP-diacylglycerol--glycerol-3-phosphate 3-phosphatidyltransferase n=1 Tax=Vallitalea pronyensis TaxID=1348613 RepID=A0A8J8SF79_9FIRM|nr:CDP-diacylglycerol--glycerol-3-phosphate 3-phosphatidyltransferase [Vallitalea pronyensis]QUI21014.1 CDP-diacylglycerol--glycerol-3-phosphate 3-phosphatidyltransferase [Vallitalea pronyensis]